jgi:hypothetical protein
MPMPKVCGSIPSRSLKRSNSVLVSEPRQPSANSVSLPMSSTPGWKFSVGLPS